MSSFAICEVVVAPFMILILTDQWIIHLIKKINKMFEILSVTYKLSVALETRNQIGKYITQNKTNCNFTFESKHTGTLLNFICPVKVLDIS